MPQLDLSTFPSQIFWLLVCFGVLFFAITVFVVPYLGTSLQQRHERLDRLRREAEKMLAEAHRLSTYNQETLDNAQKEAAARLNQIMLEISDHKSARLVEFDQKTHRKILAMQASLAHEKEKIFQEADKLVAHLSGEIYYRLTGQQLAEGALKNLVDVTIRRELPTHD